MLANVLVPSLVIFGLATAFFLWVWFTTGPYAKSKKEPRD